MMYCNIYKSKNKIPIRNKKGHSLSATTNDFQKRNEHFIVIIDETNV